ncbi:hypothetical protein UQW22_12335 [Isoptericola halotolerans]|uniref:hypothetical protein n=1 Tax=Isoptericola halotolerans TaxID=300560 RepID=UPI00388E741D
MAPALPWGTAGPGAAAPGPAAPEPARAAPAPSHHEAGASPFAAVVGQGQSARIDLAPDADEDEEWDEAEPSYTWLHYIVLVVVAFVLGLLLWNLLLDGPGDEDFATEEAAAPVATSAAASDEGGPR